MALSNKIFFDANVVVEIALQRERMQTSIEYLQKNVGRVYVSSLTIHLVVHFGKKHSSVASLQDLLSEFIPLGLLPEDTAWAFENTRDKDFEDALQLAVAIRTGCDIFYTFDKKLAKNYANLPTLKVILL
jgi:predicted nucleic acid-binding protein